MTSDKANSLLTRASGLRSQGSPGNEQKTPISIGKALFIVETGLI